MPAYYNEIDPYAAQWLRNLVAKGLIADGEVDTRSIVDVRADDLRGFTQCHFFGGIGGWSYALRLAGWPDDRPVWTGSCPCQPFSTAGKGKGFDDERDLWPAWSSLTKERTPPAIFGEQVFNAIGKGWFDRTAHDLETLSYAVGAAVLRTDVFGAPHQRKRLWFVGERLDDTARERPVGLRADGGLADACSQGLSLREQTDLCGEGRQGEGRATEQPSCSPGAMADTNRNGCDQARQRQSEARCDGPERDGGFSPGKPPARPTDGHWRDADWLYCRDGKWRPVEPGTFPLAHGIPNRVGRLRAYGNAIVPQVAAAFIRAYMEIEP